MQIPAMLHDESLTRLIQGIVIGVAATLFIGFYWGDLVSSGTALKMAQQEATNAVVAALAPICVEKFQSANNAPEKLIELNKLIFVWDRDVFIEKGGWATMPGASSSDTAVARACAEMLGKLINLK
jgi:hypothetical protein